MGSRGRPQEECMETIDLEATPSSTVSSSVVLLAALLPSTCPARMGNSGCTPSIRRTSRCRRSLSAEMLSAGTEQFLFYSFLWRLSLEAEGVRAVTVERNRWKDACVWLSKK